MNDAVTTTSTIDPLTRYAVKYGSDKFGAHLYTPVYHRMLQHLRHRPIKILEIGIGGYESARAGGSSLWMWEAYFPDATVTALDLAEKTIPHSDRTQIYRGSQVDPAVLAALSDERGPFDLVIDDGSHVVEHVIETFRLLYPRIDPNGTYIVEDTQTSFSDSFGGNAAGIGTIFDTAHRVALAMHHREGYRSENSGGFELEFGDITKSVAFHRNLVVFERGGNTYPSNLRMDPREREVQDTLLTMQAIAEQDPGPRSCLSRINLLLWCRAFDDAVELALDAWLRYPDNVGVLTELTRMMAWAGRPDIVSAIAAEIEGVVPTRSAS